jgi:hypothetical protein
MQALEMSQKTFKAPVEPLFEKADSLFDLAREYRALIYMMVLRPDCTLHESPCTKPHQHADSFENCTAILQTCSQEY